MSDLYNTDIITWSRQQAALLRRIAAGEHINNQIDWANVIEEIESVGRSELRAATSPLRNAMQHKLYALGWPHNPSLRHWQAEVRIQLIEAADEFRESMRDEIKLATLYRRARREALLHMLDNPPATPLPVGCPWTLDELLAEGAAALDDESGVP